MTTLSTTITAITTASTGKDSLPSANQATSRTATAPISSTTNGSRSWART